MQGATNEGTSLSVSLSFEWDVYHFIELDELILVVCFIFAHRPPNRGKQSILAVNFLSYERRFPNVSLSFECNIYQFVDLDELILVVCFVFLNEASFVQNMT